MTSIDRPFHGGLVSFESKLIDLFCDGTCVVFECGDIRIGLVYEGHPGEVTVTLVAQDMRDFCILHALDDNLLKNFTRFLFEYLKRVKACRMRIGPVDRKTSKRLQKLLQDNGSMFLFEDAVLSVEPLIQKPCDKALRTPTSLRRALRRLPKSDLRISADSLPPADMRQLHLMRWGDNRSAKFFEAIKAFTDEAYCDCISIKDSLGQVIGQQIDFLYSGKRHFYFAAYDSSQYHGIGTALLAESVNRFIADPTTDIYSFGRGGEQYKYRYANTFDLNHYIIGLRTNSLEALT